MNHSTASIRIELQPDEADLRALNQALDQYNTQQTGSDREGRIVVTLRDGEGKLAGGLIAHIDWDWLHIRTLWVQQDMRGCGFGRQLLEAAEVQARLQGCRGSHLDTFSFQAPDFYARYGYRSFGVLRDFPQGHSRHYMYKSLTEGG